MPRNLKLFTHSIGVLSMVIGVCSLLCLLKSTNSSLVLSMLSERLVFLTPFSQGTHLLSVGRLIVVSDQACHHCVISKFDDDIDAVFGYTVMCVQGVQEWAEGAAPRSTSVEDQGR